MALDLSRSCLFKFFITNLNDLNMLVGRKLFVKLIYLMLNILIYIVLGCRYREFGEVGINDSRKMNLGAYRSSNNNALGNIFYIAKILLYLLREYILTVFKNDNGFKSTCYIAIIILVKITHITGSEPAVRGEYVCRRPVILVIADHYVITLYYGEDVNESDAAELCDVIAEKYPDVDVSFQNGGQSVYYYIIALE